MKENVDSKIAAGLYDPAESTAQKLRERAKILAKQNKENLADDPVLNVIQFCVGSQQLGISARYVVEVGPIADITLLPGTPTLFAGLTNVHGRILPVYNLLGLLGFDAYGITDIHQIIVVAADDIEIAFLADLIGGVRELRLSSLQEALTKSGPRDLEFVQGITTDQLVLVNVLSILRSDEILINHPAG